MFSSGLANSQDPPGHEKTAAPRRIRTPDPQIRRQVEALEGIGEFCKPGAIRRQTVQCVSGQLQTALSVSEPEQVA